MGKKNQNWSEDFQIPGLSFISRYFVAHGFTVLLLFLSVIPFYWGELSQIKPLFIVMVIYFWTVYRPSLLPPVFVFLLGVLMDLMMAWPLGISAFVYTGIQWLVRTQRRFLMGQSFFVFWGGFMLVALLAGIAHWGLFCLLNLTFINILPVFFNIGVSIFLFPFILLPLFLIHKLLNLGQIAEA